MVTISNRTRRPLRRPAESVNSATNWQAGNTVPFSCFAKREAEQISFSADALQVLYPPSHSNRKHTHAGKREQKAAGRLWDGHR